jgi:hypothetical protein
VYAACFLTGPHGAVEHPMVAAEPPFLSQAHRALRAEATVLLPGARIVPASSSWTCCQTRSENGGTKGVKSRIIWAGRVRTLRSPLFWPIAVTSVPYPLRPQMAKVQQKGHFRKLSSLARPSEGVPYGTGPDLDRTCRHDSSRRTKSATASG